MENRLEYFVCYWAAIRSGLYFTTINRYLQPDEAAYIVNDSASKAVFSSRTMGELASELPALGPRGERLVALWGSGRWL